MSVAALLVFATGWWLTPARADLLVVLLQLLGVRRGEVLEVAVDQTLAKFRGQVAPTFLVPVHGDADALGVGLLVAALVLATGLITGGVVFLGAVLLALVLILGPLPLVLTLVAVARSGLSRFLSLRLRGRRTVALA